MVYRIAICVGTDMYGGFVFVRKKKDKKNIFLTLLKQCLKKIPRDVDKADFFVVFISFFAVFLFVTFDIILNFLNFFLWSRVSFLS